MNKDINTLITETLNSLNDIQRVNPPEGLSYKIMNRINQQKNIREVYLFKHPQWMIAALLIGIICNVCFAIGYQNTATKTETSEVSSFVSHFKLGSSSIY